MRLLLFCCLGCALLALIGCTSSAPAQPAAVTPAAAPAPAGPTVHAIITTSAGEIEVELYPDKAPRTVANFIALVKRGFYTNLIFHRIIRGFMIQGGGFNIEGRQVESPLGTIPLEINPALTHVDGALAMARTNDPNSAGAQFYICHGAQPNLDRNYAVFGQVVRGLEVVLAIAANPTVNRGGPFTNLPDPLVIIKSARMVE